MSYLGMNIYCSDSDQKRLLLGNLRSWVQESRVLGISDLFWYRRFDARGPHIFAVFGGQASLEDFFAARIAAFLGRCNARNLTIAEIERRHRQCRGKALCDLDQAPGIQETNSFLSFDLTPKQYPLLLTKEMASSDVFWQYMDSLTLCLLEYLEEGIGRSAAIVCCRAVDGSLGRYGLSSHEYWRRHAERLVPTLQRRGITLERARDWLELALSPRNRHSLGKFWNRTDPNTVKGAAIVNDLVNTIMLDEKLADLDDRLHILEEITELIFNHLWQPLSIQTVMVLYAWSRSLNRTDPSSF